MNTTENNSPAAILATVAKSEGVAPAASSVKAHLKTGTNASKPAKAKPAAKDTKAKSTTAAPKTIKAAKAPEALMHFVLPASAKEGATYTIVPEGVYGKERWFKNDQYHTTAVAGGRLQISITPSQMKAREMPVAQAKAIK